MRLSRSPYAIVSRSPYAIDRRARESRCRRATYSRTPNRSTRSVTRRISAPSHDQNSFLCGYPPTTTTTHTHTQPPPPNQNSFVWLRRDLFSEDSIVEHTDQVYKSFDKSVRAVCYAHAAPVTHCTRHTLHPSHVALGTRCARHVACCAYATTHTRARLQVPVAPGDLFVVSAADVHGRSYLFASFHGGISRLYLGCISIVPLRLLPRRYISGVYLGCISAVSRQIPTGSRRCPCLPPSTSSPARCPIISSSSASTRIRAYIGCISAVPRPLRNSCNSRTARARSLRHVAGMPSARRRSKGCSASPPTLSREATRRVGATRPTRPTTRHSTHAPSSRRLPRHVSPRHVTSRHVSPHQHVDATCHFDGAVHVAGAAAEGGARRREDHQGR